MSPRGNSENTKNRDYALPKDIGTDFNFKRKIVWFNAIGFLILHILALYGVYRGFHSNKWTPIWAYMIAFVSSEGVIMGAHRLYSHRCFKATWGLRLALIIFQTVAGQNCLYIWVRDHRLHHKYSDTDADPHNAKRGFFFSHIGWLMSRKHPLVIEKGKSINLSDLESDSLVMFQKKWYKLLYTIFAIIIPVAFPMYFWTESLQNSLFICYFARYMLQLHGTWLINSATHLFGIKPYDKSIMPVENDFISAIALGEGFHNYHHSFPSDYRAAEYGLKYSITTFLIDLLAYFGFAYDLKQAEKESVVKRVQKYGDGSHPNFPKKDTEGLLFWSQYFIPLLLKHEEDESSGNVVTKRFMTNASRG